MGVIIKENGQTKNGGRSYFKVFGSYSLHELQNSIQTTKKLSEEDKLNTDEKKLIESMKRPEKRKESMKKRKTLSVDTSNKIVLKKVSVPVFVKSMKGLDMVDNLEPIAGEKVYTRKKNESVDLDNYKSQNKFVASILKNNQWGNYFGEGSIKRRKFVKK